MRVEHETTEVVQDEKRVLQTILSFLNRASSRLDLSVSYVGPRTGAEVVAAIREARKRGVSVRMVTEVSKDNLEVVRTASEFMDIRHIGGLKGSSWGVTEDEYISSLAAGEFRVSLPIIYSNSRPLVDEHTSIFDALWYRGEPLSERVEALKAGTDLPEMEIIREATRAKALYLSLAGGAREKVLLLLPTSSAFRRDERLGVIRLLERRAAKGVKVKLLLPVDPHILARLSKSSGRGIQFKAIQEAESRETVTILVVDGRASLTIDERDPSQEDFGQAFGSAIVLTSESRVRQNTRTLDRIWKESELAEVEKVAKEKEEVHRKRAELMQDILTHDIRNFNQVARLNAELLEEEVKDQEALARISAILRAVDGSSRLIERAKKLGNILAAWDVPLRPVSLEGSFKRSVQLVRMGNLGAKLKIEGRLTGKVLADNLLDEVFVNLISNSVKYTEGNLVVVAVEQKPDELPGDAGGPSKRCWRVSVTDRGKGMPDSQKEAAFKRYLESAKGSGLGLSIVNALVTERYHGRVVLRNRVEGDFAMGTTAEIWLPRP